MSTTDGIKSDDSEFASILNKHLIFCLQETKGDVNLPDYKCLNKLRTGSRSGGLCIGVHKTLANNIKKIPVRSSDIQVIQVGINPEKKDEKLTIINVYDSPENSSYKKKLKRNSEINSTLDDLLAFFNRHPNLQNCILVGDFNARTNDQNHILMDEIHEDNCQTISSGPLDSNRISHDKVINQRGRLFLDMLSCVNLTILNGNIVGDLLGEFTCQQYNGCSVVDYIAVTPYTLQNICTFQVLELTPYSDHRPCTCVLNISHCYTLSNKMLASF